MKGLRLNFLAFVVSESPMQRFGRCKVKHRLDIISLLLWDLFSSVGTSTNHLLVAWHRD